MTNAKIICPKCKSGMEEGFVLDQTHGGATVSHWVEGEPENSIWTGVKTKDRENLAVKTFRCDRCGYLESYAPASQE
ncbi:MAG: PF20097 family protein [Acidobacteriota bacterium]|nr:PF20097 family protein [Acidobacteriota bacterium]